MTISYECEELQYKIDEINRVLARLRIQRKHLMYQKKCFKNELERILRSHKN